LVTTLFVSLLLIVDLNAQTGLPAYKGRFTLAQPVQWNTTILQPGDYMITIESTGSPVVALISTASGNQIALLRTLSRSDSTNGRNALLLEEENGRLQVYSLSLADLGMVLIYNPALARQTVLESQVSQTVPVMSAKR